MNSESSMVNRAKLTGLIEESFRTMKSEQFILEPDKYDRIIKELKGKLGEDLFTKDFTEGKNISGQQSLIFNFNEWFMF